MALRLIEIVLPNENSDNVQGLLKEQQLLSIWYEELSEGHTLVKILLLAEKTEAVLDLLEKNFSMINGFRIIILPVEASIPRPREEKTSKEEEPLPEQSPETKAVRISREELYADIIDTTKLSKIYVAMVLLSSIVAAFGLLGNNVAVIIGAMVLAPMLGPNVALSLATALGDVTLTRIALKANAVGILITLILSVFTGFIFTVNPDVPEIASRTKVGLDAIVIALASGRCRSSRIYNRGLGYSHRCNGGSGFASPSGSIWAAFGVRALSASVRGFIIIPSKYHLHQPVWSRNLFSSGDSSKNLVGS